MKHTLISSALLATLFISATAHATYGGRVNFEGQVVTGACAVSSNSTDFKVPMGQVRTASFAAVGDVSGSVPFKIELEECDTAIANTAQVAFMGTSDAGNDLALAIGSGAGTARGVGIYITDSTATVLQPDGATRSTPVTLVDGKNVLPFQARYVATSLPVAAGTANATATFNVFYQ